MQTFQLQIPESLNLKLDSLLQKVETLEQSFKNQQPAEPNYIPRLKLAKKLEIDPSSLHNWVKKGVLQPYQIGGKIYFKMDEVEKAMIKLK